jgi:hypothetical protein
MSGLVEAVEGLPEEATAADSKGWKLRFAGTWKRIKEEKFKEVSLLTRQAHYSYLPYLEAS